MTPEERMRDADAKFVEHTKTCELCAKDDLILCEYGAQLLDDFYDAVIAAAARRNMEPLT